MGDSRQSATTRDRLIQAARNVFARYGYEGATTRRIAREADVHEVTMFRLFGSKDALLDEAVRVSTTEEHAIPLPETPSDPLAELSRWCAAEIRRLAELRSVIMQCLSEEATHPELAQAGASPLTGAAEELNRYVERLKVKPSVTESQRKAAVTMLLAALYSDALGRPTIPGVHALAQEEAPLEYARFFLRGIGFDQ